LRQATTTMLKLEEEKKPVCNKMQIDLGDDRNGKKDADAAAAAGKQETENGESFPDENDYKLQQRGWISTVGISNSGLGAVYTCPILRTNRRTIPRSICIQMV
jgi:hypothetical protein